MARPKRNGDAGKVSCGNAESVSAPAVSRASAFANACEREAWIRREAAHVLRFVGNEHEARRIAEMHATGNVAAFNALRGW